MTQQTQDEYDGPTAAAADPDDRGRGLDLWAKIGISLETLTRQLERREKHEQHLWQSLHQVSMSGPVLEQPGQVYDQPETLGPSAGWYWDVHRITLAPEITFTAGAWTVTPWTGTVYVFNGNVSPSSLVDIFTAPGSHWYGRGTLLLGRHQRLIYLTSSSFAGTGFPGGAASQVSDDCLPDYLS